MPDQKVIEKMNEKNRIVTTPTYMLGKSIAEIDVGIGKLAKAILEMID